MIPSNNIEEAKRNVDEKTRAILALDLIQVMDKAITELHLQSASSVRALLRGMSLAAEDIIKSNEMKDHG